MKTIKILAVLLCVLFIYVGTALGEEDVEGAKDHPMFSRMPNYHIVKYSSNFDMFAFPIAQDKTEKVEGQMTYIEYTLKEGANKPSPLQIMRNYTNAIKKIGGVVVYEGQSETADRAVTCKVVKGGQEVWLFLNPAWQNSYAVTVVEKGEMVQEVTASDMLTALNKDGRVALHILFDTGQATIKPESQPIIDQVVTLMKDNPDLKLGVEGHTDNVGTPASNKVLSEKRAAAVVAALTKAGIAQNRLTSAGFGQEKPIADNGNEEGRAQNRRVELVKK
ncbi:MAG: OmpA family protein [Pseudomonadota bacterium]